MRTWEGTMARVKKNTKSEIFVITIVNTLDLVEKSESVMHDIWNAKGEHSLFLVEI